MFDFYITLGFLPTIMHILIITCMSRNSLALELAAPDFLRLSVGNKQISLFFQIDFQYTDLQVLKKKIHIRARV